MRRTISHAIVTLITSILLAAPIGSYAAAAPKDETHQWSLGKVTFTPHAWVSLANDFRWRGRSLSNGRAVVMGVFALKTNRGFYADIFASNVKFGVKNNQQTSILLLPSFGFAGKVKDFGFDMGVSGYLYPSTEDVNWVETYLRLNYRFVIAGVYYTGNFLQTGSDAMYAYGGVRYQLPDTNKYTKDLVFRAVIARNAFFEGPLRNIDFTSYEVGLTKKFAKHYTFGVALSDSNNTSPIIPFTNTRIVASLSAMI